MDKSEIDAEHKRERNRIYKREQRLRDEKPGARHEKTYRATTPEHKVLKHTLAGLRKPK